MEIAELKVSFYDYRVVSHANIADGPTRVDSQFFEWIGAKPCTMQHNHVPLDKLATQDMEAIGYSNPTSD